MSAKNLFKGNTKGKDVSDEKRVEELVIKTGEDEIPIEESEEKQKDIVITQEQPEEEKYIDNTPQSVTKNDSLDQMDDEKMEPTTPKYTNWVFPTLDLLKEPERQSQNKDRYKKDALIIEQTLKSFGIQGKVVQIAIGPTVVRYSLSISVGTKVSKIKN